MTSRLVSGLHTLVGALVGGMALAQPADLPIPPATTTIYPPGVRILETNLGPSYGTKKGQPIYGLDMRVLLRAGPDPAAYCTGPCADQWKPLLAPKGSTPNIMFPPSGGSNWQPPAGFVHPQRAPDWTIIAGPQGPQWVYKGWHLAFTRKGEKRGRAAFDGAENRSWNVLRFVPPVPRIVAPGGVKPVFVDNAYALADKDGHLLFSGTCARDCQAWIPFPGGLASAGLGEWKVNTEGEVPQWMFRGQAVFVSSEAEGVPEGGKVLRP